MEVGRMKIGTLLKVSGPAVLIASLCCLTPVVFVLLGASVTSFGIVLFTKILGPYEWVFQLLGLVLPAGSVTVYLRRSGICTFDQASARRNEVINVTLLTLISGTIGYGILFVIVGYTGELLRLWT